MRWAGKVNPPDGSQRQDEDVSRQSLCAVSARLRADARVQPTVEIDTADGDRSDRGARR